MSRAYDGQYQPLAEFDPNKQLQFALDKAVKELGGGLFDLVDLVFEAAKERIKEVVDTLIGTITDPDEMVDELRNWVENLPNLMDTAIQQLKDQLTGIVNATPTDIDDWLLGLLTSTSPLNAAHLFGQLKLPQFGGGVPLTDLTTVASNQLEPFTGVSVPTADGWSYDAVEDAARVIADGTTKTLYLRSGVIKVEEDQPLNTSIPVKYSGVTSGAGPTIRYVLETFTSPDGSGTPVPVTVSSITSPSGSIGSPVSLGDSEWEIPPGVQSVRPVLVVDELMTSGTVWWKNTPQLHKILTGVLSGGIAAAIQARIDSLQEVLDTFKGAAGGTVADITTALNQAGQATRDAIVQAMGGSGTGHSTTDVLNYLQTMPDTLEDIGKVFEDNLLEPLDDVTTKIWDFAQKFFFGGGPKTIISQEVIASPSGLPPMDAITKIPYVYLPEEFMTVAMGMPWCEMTKTSGQSIPASTETTVTGWSQDGPAVLDIASNKFKPAFDGMWNIEIGLQWAGTIALYQNNVKVREFTGNTGIMSVLIPAATADEFYLTVFHTSSGTVAAGTYVRATYMGFTTVPSLPPPPPDVTFDKVGAGGALGWDDHFTWTHNFGVDAKAIVIPVMHQYTAPVITVGGHNVPALGPRTYIGNYLGFDSYHTLFGAILPDTVKGNAQTVDVAFSADNAASAFSATFNHAHSLGTQVLKTGSGSPNIFVPSNVSSMVMASFGAVTTNFSGFNRTQVWNEAFVPFVNWAHLGGYARGGSSFAATNSGKWCAKAVELHS